MATNGNDITDISIGKYENNRIAKTSSKSIMIGSTKDNFFGFYHVHPGGTRKLFPSDIDSHNSSLKQNSKLNFYILTKSGYGELGKIP